MNLFDRPAPTTPAERLAAALRASELDRRRIARELHDHLGQTLAAANIALDMAKLPDMGNEVLDEAQEAVREAARTTREFTFALRAPLLAEKGLGAALDAFAQGLAERIPGAPSVRVDVPARRYDLALEIALYRIGQELLRNTVAHGAARTMTVTLTETAGHCDYAFADDGRGFNPLHWREAADPRQFGLRIVEALAQALGGTVVLDAGAGRGTRIAISLPAAG